MKRTISSLDTELQTIKAHHLLQFLKTLNKRTIIGTFVVLLIMLAFFVFTEIQADQVVQLSNEAPEIMKHSFNGNRLLINTSTCKIPNTNPWSDDIIKFVKREHYVPCTNKELLSYIAYDKFNNSVLYINRSALGAYSSFFTVSCCYSRVERKVDDKSISVSGCTYIEKSAIVEDVVIQVTCSIFFSMYDVYVNVHANIRKSQLQRKVEPSNKPSIVFIGIDSMSQQNLIRTMPKTLNFLERNDYINMRGYTKVGSNTFPNFMAILSGKSIDETVLECDFDENYMDFCSLIWDRFRDNGYVTIYAEDYSTLNTFNYLKRGFRDPPTDFYLLNYFQAAENLFRLEYDEANHLLCTGPEYTAERIMNIIRNFIDAFTNYPKFGLFWINSISHNNPNSPSGLDDLFLQFFKQLTPNLENIVLVFLSDHGMRFGNLRQTDTGYNEERLPFIYFHLPKSLDQNFKNNLIYNSKRLTSPYDVYMTLQHLLMLSNSSYVVKPSDGCRRCRSLFDKVPENRTCYYAGIGSEWCLCNRDVYINVYTPLVQKIAKFAVKKLNQLISTIPHGEKCAIYDLYKPLRAIQKASKLNKNNESVDQFLVRFETYPYQQFEVFVHVYVGEPRNIRIIGNIETITSYANYGYCVKNIPVLVRYCYCDDIFTRIRALLEKFFFGSTIQP